MADEATGTDAGILALPVCVAAWGVCRNQVREGFWDHPEDCTGNGRIMMVAGESRLTTDGTYWK